MKIPWHGGRFDDYPKRMRPEGGYGGDPEVRARQPGASLARAATPPPTDAGETTAPARLTSLLPWRPRHDHRGPSLPSEDTGVPASDSFHTSARISTPSYARVSRPTPAVALPPSNLGRLRVGAAARKRSRLGRASALHEKSQVGVETAQVLTIDKFLRVSERR